MNDLDPTTLSDEQKNELIAALFAERANAAAVAPAETHDEPDGDEQLPKWAEMLYGQLKAICERLDPLEDVVMNGLVEPINQRYTEGIRSSGIDALSAKYGDLFAPHLDAIKALEGENADPLSALYDHLQDVKKTTPDLSEEDESSGVQAWVKSIADALDAKRSALGPGASVEKTTVTAVPAGTADKNLQDKVQAKIAAMKAKNAASGKNINL